MSSSTTWKIGQKVQLNDGRSATIRFVGSLHFTVGEWVGVELEDASGKNDGSVKGERYFECASGHGIFLKPNMIARAGEQQSLPMPSSSRAASTQPAREKSSSGVSGSMLSRSPTKAVTGQRLARGPTADSPSQASSKSGVKCNPQSSKTLLGRPRLSMVSQSSDVNLRRQSSTISNPIASRDGLKRMSLAMVSNGNERVSISASSSSSGIAEAQTHANAIANDAADRRSARTSGSSHQHANSALSVTGTTCSSFAPELAVSGKSSDNYSLIRTETSEPILQAEQIASQKVRGVSKMNKEVSELQIKLRVVERKRQEDREKLKVLDRLQQDKEKFDIIIQKLRAKYQPVQNELLEAKEKLSKADEKLQSLERNQAEHDSAVEMATLDREMAEEMADAYKSELEALRATLEEAQLENDVLKEENEELGKEMSSEERTSKGWLQMERENERLRQALLRLRELTQEQELELRKIISGLEDDVNMLSNFKEQYEEKDVNLSQAQADIENLRSRLEAALGAEEMIEELTDKNMVLFERIEELQATVEDLQNLKELNDELEINHIEHGKQLQETINLKDEVIDEQSRKASHQSKMLAEQQYVIDRFRGLISSLQSDLEGMRASKEITESESYELNSRTKAIMDLNLKLQTSITKGQARTIDTELRNLDAKQAMENLAIAKLFLPEEFMVDKDSIEALLQFKRIGFKANLIHTVIKEKFSENSMLGIDDGVHLILSILNFLLKISSFCDKYVHEISTSSTNHFASFKNISHELGPVERILVEIIQTLKKDELRFAPASEELERSFTVLLHLSNTYAQSGIYDYSSDSSRRMYLVQKRVEDITSAISLIELQTEPTIPRIQGYETTSPAQKSNLIATQLRGAKTIIFKIVNSLQDHNSHSLSLTDKSQLLVEKCEHAIEQLFKNFQKLGQAQSSEDGKYISFGQCEDHDASKTPAFLPSYNISTLLDLLMSDVQSLKVSLAQLAQLSQGFSSTVEISRPPAPWVLRARDINKLKSVPVTAETDLKNLRNAISNAAGELLHRESALEDAKVKIELLETRAKDSSLKSARIDQLQKALEQYHMRADELAKTVQNYNTDMKTIAAERDQLRQDVEQKKKDGWFTSNSESGSYYEQLLITKMQEIFPLRAENNVLRAALKFLYEQSRNHQTWTFLSKRCGIISENNPLRESSPSGMDHRRRNISGSEVPTPWIAAPLVTRQDYASYSISAPKATKLFVSDPAMLPKPIFLSKLSDRSSRLEWQPLRCTSKWRLFVEEKKMTLWSQRWLSIKQM